MSGQTELINSPQLSDGDAGLSNKVCFLQRINDTKNIKTNAGFGGNKGIKDLRKQKTFRLIIDYFGDCRAWLRLARNDKLVLPTTSPCRRRLNRALPENPNTRVSRLAEMIKNLRK